MEKVHAKKNSRGNSKKKSLREGDEDRKRRFTVIRAGGGKYSNARKDERENA